MFNRNFILCHRHGFGFYIWKSFWKETINLPIADNSPHWYQNKYFHLNCNAFWNWLEYLVYYFRRKTMINRCILRKDPRNSWNTQCLYLIWTIPWHKCPMMHAFIYHFNGMTNILQMFIIIMLWQKMMIFR